MALKVSLDFKNCSLVLYKNHH